MSGKTSIHKLPYPTAGDPVYLGAKQIQDLAEAIDVKLGTAGGNVSATSAATPDTLMKRDIGGRTQVADPLNALDAANRQWVLAQGYQTAAQVDQKIQDAGAIDGGGTGTTTPESVTATAGSLAKRDSSGRTQVSNPVAALDAANMQWTKSYVDGRGFITVSSLSNYATKTDLQQATQLPADVVRTSTIDDMRAELFGGSTRTKAPFTEVLLGSNIPVPRSVDWLADNRWISGVDTDSAFIRSSLNNQTRWVAPVNGRYLISYHLAHLGTDRSGGACKILLNGTDVLKNSIATATVGSTLEGPNMNLTTDIYLAKGDAIRWGYWYADGATIIPAALGKCRSKITFRYVGSS